MPGKLIICINALWLYAATCHIIDIITGNRCITRKSYEVLTKLIKNNFYKYS